MTATRKPRKPARADATRRAVIYLRISRDRDNQTSIESQERACRAYAEAQGWDVVGVETDQGRSAFSGKSRPAFNRSVRMVEDGLADVLLVWAIDRAARSTIELDRLLRKLSEQGAGFASATQPVDTTSPMGIAMIKIVGVLAELESAMKSERMYEFHRNRKRNGVPAAGPRSLGYRRDGSGGMEIDGDEAETVLRIFRDYLAGETMNGIARQLDAEGVRTPQGKQFACQTIRGILRNPTYAGLMLVDDVPVPAPWDAIVPRAEWDAAQEQRDDETVPRGRNTRQALLTGLLHCGLCGHRMVGGLPRAKGPRYRCTGPDCWNGVAEALADEYVVGVKIGSISPERWRDMLAGANGVDPTIALRAQLEQVAADYGDGLITRAEWTAFRERITARIAAAEADGFSRSELPDVADLAAAWDSLPVEQQRTVLAAFVSRIDVNRSAYRGRRFDPDRFVFTDRV